MGTAVELLIAYFALERQPEIVELLKRKSDEAINAAQELAAAGAAWSAGYGDAFAATLAGHERLMRVEGRLSAVFEEHGLDPEVLHSVKVAANVSRIYQGLIGDFEKYVPKWDTSRPGAAVWGAPSPA